MSQPCQNRLFVVLTLSLPWNSWVPTKSAAWASSPNNPQEPCNNVASGHRFTTQPTKSRGMNRMDLRVPNTIHPRAGPLAWRCSFYSWPHSTVLLHRHELLMTIKSISCLHRYFGEISWYPALYSLLFRSKNFSYKANLLSNIINYWKTETKFSNQFRMTWRRFLVAERWASLFSSFY